MRNFFLILLLLIPLHGHAAAPPSGAEYAAMPVQEWLGLTYRQQIKSVKAIVSLKKLEMCHKQILAAVNCMRDAGTAPAWESSKALDLMMKCSFDMGETPCPIEKM